ncbi:hypothetical protein [Bacillus pumilus]|uniref:DUF4145 domain-containing protein n=1 Tax=Bacillus pumilus (strain SAFR-032) TaxID=315750 RepID=A8FAH9_BACP2|nr:hypothetical protein [Bacillus pumilus]ABV61246.2 hypothetical protein BPUM_0553 [Bacillus pumilus SAFR-032]MBC3643654.1 hypothetical protein [Bacillus pumilus]MBC3645890.1 hypothetical protein [Bacillus pumilus]MBC3649922.1 hypothetical protein [Bacillus pumilus]MBC3653887.1 hypothetical protein [Bacillus pumilus]
MIIIESQDIFKIFQYEMNKDKIKEITQEQKTAAFEWTYNQYMNLFNQLSLKPDKLEDFFSFTSKKLDLNIVYYLNDEKDVKLITFFSKSENTGTINIYDVIDQKFSFEILNSSERVFISELINKGIVDIDPQKIIESGILETGGVVYEVGKYLFKKEYRENWKPQLKTPVEKLNFNSLRIHKEIYEFEDMIDNINNLQFTLELEECLDAYENEKFFLCATGLGSVLEHLLYLAIEKHVEEKDIKTNENSTASEYIGQLKKAPFEISKREVSHLKNIFAYRNSVSHYNKGIFSKEMCDHLLNGIKTSFDNYYMFKDRAN